MRFDKVTKGLKGRRCGPDFYVLGQRRLRQANGKIALSNQFKAARDASFDLKYGPIQAPFMPWNLEGVRWVGSGADTNELGAQSYMEIERGEDNTWEVNQQRPC